MIDIQVSTYQLESITYGSLLKWNYNKDDSKMQISIKYNNIMPVNDKLSEINL